MTQKGHTLGTTDVIKASPPKSLQILPVIVTVSLSSTDGKSVVHTLHLSLDVLIDNPESAIENEIIATPTIIKLDPKPEKRATGALSDPEKIKKELELKKRDKT